MNTYAVFSIMFVIASKLAVNEYEVDAMDMTLIANFMIFIIAFIAIVICRSQLSFVIPRGSRTIFFARVFEGWIHIVVYIIGNTLVPVTVQ